MTNTGSSYAPSDFLPAVSDLLSYKGDLYVDSTMSKVSLDIEVFELGPNSSSDPIYSGSYGSMGKSVTATSDVVVRVKVASVDYLANGYETNVHTGDSVDDREQTVYDFRIESWSGLEGKGTGKFTEKQVVADDKNTLEAVIAAYSDWRTVGGDIWELVFYVNGNDVKAVWEKNPDETIIYNSTPAADNELDTNGDGKISCDEYYKTTGLVWSDEKNACVVESNGAVVVTIPNTATK